ncbi:hypothetical protein [Paenibacillus sp. FSL R7-0331]|uniref:hypothetical protein n=1 Tax=Paenibacillus sp. FSL R7-0331 TaxID=1536773 RepID=UPI0004F8AEB6|nr:hypothetical protein [Paenibacillus sp. FSL R7-0331]AIQ50970.1 hypothetical protein R70331_05135 [Paenibacillus sp. FSL R7-0331]
MKIAITLLLYILAFILGCRMLTDKGYRLHRLWYGCILAWCAYVNICGITGTPHISVASFYTSVFQPAGRVIIDWLGG